MKIAFYKAFQEKATVLDKTIGICSIGKYSHVELVFSDGMCFSISARDKGARFKKINLKPEQWETINLNITPEEEEEMYNLAKEYIGKKYDYIGAIFSISPFCIQKNNRLFCSEVAVNLMHSIAKFQDLKDGCMYSPSKLYKKI